MNQYRGDVRRPSDQTGTKGSWQNDKKKFQQGQQQKYSRNNDFQKSQLSYYQSQVSHTIYENNNVQQSRVGGQKIRILSNSQNKELYDNLIPIKVQSTDRDEYFINLRIQIIMTSEKGVGKLTLYITDDQDPKFLWLFFIKQSDYLILKREQNLRVEFQDFPTMLMDHFDMCKTQKQAMTSSKMGDCCFFSMMEIKKNQGSLNILEANRYKNSVHLSLKCKLGNDEQIKQYLSDKLLKCQSQNSHLQETVSNLEHSLSTRKQQISRLQIQLKQERKINQKSSQSYTLEISRKQTELRRQRIQNQQRIKKQYQKQFKQMKSNLEEQKNRIAKSYDQLKSKHEVVQQKLSSLESKQRQASFDINNKSKEVDNYLKRLDQMKSYTMELENKSTENQRTIIEQRVKIESLESQITDKIQIIESNSQLKSTNSHQISSLQTKNQQYKRQIEKLQSKIESLQGQMEKIQSLLEDYRQKYQHKKQKNHQKNAIIKQQQRFISNQENQIFQIKRQLQTRQKLIDQGKLDVDQRDRKINQLKRQIDECQKKIKEDNDLITHLQKQLNERTIGIRSGIGSTSYQRSISPYTSSVTANRDYLASNSSLGNTSTSRLKFTSTGGQQNEEISSDKGGFNKKQIQIKRYTPNNDESLRERSKSPITNSRLNQQKDPEQFKGSSNSIKPVKFKHGNKQ